MSDSRRTAPIPTDRRRRLDDGLTLLEMVLVLLLVAVFMGAIYQSILVGLRSVNAADEREAIRQQLANTLERFTREARMARVVDVAQATRFQFDADFDGDGSSTGNEVDINYRVQNGAFERVQGGTTVTMIGDLSTLIFDYTDVNGADMHPPVTAGNRADIRVVDVTATADNDDETVSMASAVFLTNM